MWFHTLVFNFQASERKRSTNDQYILLVYIPILPAFVITSSKESIAFEDDCPIRRDINLDSSPTAIQINIGFSRCNMGMAKINSRPPKEVRIIAPLNNSSKYYVTCSSPDILRTQKPSTDSDCCCSLSKFMPGLPPMHLHPLPTMFHCMLTSPLRPLISAGFEDK